MGKPENILFNSVKSRLDYWRAMKVVIHHDDIRRLNLKCIRGQYFSNKPKGTPDIVAYIKYNGICAIYFIELKSNNDQVRDSQLEFMMKFKDLSNIWYDFIRTGNEVDSRIENITGFISNQLKEII